METYQVAKWKQQLGGIILCTVGFLFVGMGLVGALMQDTQLTLLWGVGLAFGLCLYLEAAFFFASKNVYTSDEWKKVESKDWSSKIGTIGGQFFLLRAIFINVKGLLISLLCFGLFVYASYKALSEQESIRLNLVFFAELCVYPLYFFVIRKPFLSILKKFKGALNTYTLDLNGITIFFPIKDLSNPGKQFSAHLDFNELSEINIMTFWEATDYLKYQVGPDIKQRYNGVMGLMTMMKNNTRPEVYLAVQSGTVILLRGEKIFYLITIEGDGKDLLAAYKASKAIPPSPASSLP